VRPRTDKSPAAERGIPQLRARRRYQGQPSLLCLVTAGEGEAMPDAPPEEPPGAAQTRRVDRRRTYNRRQEDRELSPPYFEVFERIAVALEQIARELADGHVTLPDVPARTPAERR
jgi:hypothetical protein